MDFYFDFGTDITPQHTIQEEPITVLEQEHSIPQDLLANYLVQVKKERFSCSISKTETSPQNISLEKVLIDNPVELLRHEKMKNNDVIPQIYEGGFKLWECAIDLIQFLFHNNLIPSMNGKHLLELGCGHALPLISILLSSHPTSLHFQDYNREVIDYVTIPNVLLNTSQHTQLTSLCKFWSGDWRACKFGDQKFDFIFSTDTLYEIRSQQYLYNLIKQVLQKDGVCYLAAKSFYFGCSGSVATFRELIQKDGVMELETVCKIKDGLSNIREILALRFK